MISLDEALRTVLDASPVLAPSQLEVADALGCVLAAPAAARIDVPPFANSAMDGYALRAADVAGAPVTLPVAGRVLAGSSLAGGLPEGHAARIMTGAPVPAGADAVCMVERTRAEGPQAQEVTIEVAVSPGENVREAGSDVRAGETVLDAGTVLGPTQLAALISAGCLQVVAHPRPRVGVVSTGDELVDAGGFLGPAQIYDSNRPMLLGLVDAAGCVAVDLGRAADDEEALIARIEEALDGVDALVLSGGVSVGDLDVVRMALERMGADATRWMQIAIRPAKPFSFTTLESGHGLVSVFGLPGNPVSSAVSFELLVRPALRQMAGHRRSGRRSGWATLAEPVRRRSDGRVHFVRVQLDPAGGDGWRARPCAGQGSHQIRSMAVADGLAVVPDGTGAAEGELVEVIVTNPDVAGWSW